MYIWDANKELLQDVLNYKNHLLPFHILEDKNNIQCLKAGV